MKSTIRFWQEQQPNGLIADSSNRLIFIGGWIMVFALIWFWELSNKTVDYYLLAVIITAITGTKLYSKTSENNALSKESENKPESVKLAETQVKQTIAEKSPDQENRTTSP